MDGAILARWFSYPELWEQLLVTNDPRELWLVVFNVADKTPQKCMELWVVL